jgi:hypothetical protein
VSTMISGVAAFSIGSVGLIGACLLGYGLPAVILAAVVIWFGLTSILGAYGGGPASAVSGLVWCVCWTLGLLTLFV